MLFDSHCHIQFKGYDADREEVLTLCKEKNVWMNAVGTQYSTSKMAVELAEKNSSIFATIGLHPIQEHEVEVVEEGSSFTTRGEVFDMESYRSLAKNPKVIAIGETGFDRFHVPKDASLSSVMKVQYDTFISHALLASELGLPMVFHVREAHEDLRSALVDLRQKGVSVRGVVHCFSGTSEDAKWYLDYGLYLGFTGVVTFPAKKSALDAYEDFQGILRSMPIEKILVETDAPYLAPQTFRGKRCEPWMVEDTARYIANMRQLEYDVFKRQTVENSLVLFDKMKFSV